MTITKWQPVDRIVLTCRRSLSPPAAARAGKPVGGDPLGAAVAKTLAQGSEKVAVKGKVDLSGQSVSVVGDGAFNRDGRPACICA